MNKAAKRLPISGPSITDREVAWVTDAVKNGWYSTANQFHDKFEAIFRAHTGRKFAVALPSCTSAIHLGLSAFGVKSGDEVIVPDATWIASAAPISYVGATPVFADVDEATWCVTAKSIEHCITPRTKAIITVGLYGSMPDFDSIHSLAKSRGIAVLEDAAEALGSQYHGKHAGAFGDVAVFSFHGSKTVTTGEGGMLVCDREDLYKRICFLRDHGRAPGNKQFWNSEVAFKYKMSSMQAALGIAQMERVDELVDTKRKIFGWYKSGLAGLRGVTLNAEPDGVKNSYWMVTAIFDPSLRISKEDLIAKLSDWNIDSRPFFYPLSSLPAYENSPDSARARRENSVSYRVSQAGVNLPCGALTSQSDVQYVCDVLKQIVAGEK